MLIYSTAIVIISFISIINGFTFQHIENNKICTSWQPVSNSPVELDASICSGAVGYELNQYSTMYIVRFCCPYASVPEPVVGPTPSGCGRAAVKPIRTRIVGGQDAAAHSWPWLVSLQYQGNHFCGGTLIDEYHVLTAAHCLQDQSMFNFNLRVVAGLHTRTRPHPERVQNKQIASIVNHGAYSDATSENDVAIIRLSSPMKLNSYVNVACLPDKDPSVNENVMIAGWGTLSYGGSSPDTLRQANINIMDSNLCRVYHFDTNKQICGGNQQYSKDSCQGDSGGPLMYEVDGRWVLSGVVSHGDECAKVNRPGVYARVSHYLPWIRNMIKNMSTGK